MENTENVGVKLLKVNRAFHHNVEMRKVGEEIGDFVDTTIKTAKAKIPIMSNVSGSRASENEMCKGSYWRDHMTSTVRFEDNVRNIRKEIGKRTLTVFEVGPGHVLTTLWEKCNNKEFSSIRTCRGPRDKQEIHFHDLRAHCWCALNTNVFTSDFSNASFVSLPGYSFEPTSFWINPDRSIYVNATHSSSSSSIATVSTTYRHLVQLSTSKSSSHIVFGFTFAGGSARTFEKWRDDGNIDVVGIELPGHGELSEEKHLTSKEEDEIVLSTITKEIESYVERDAGKKVVLVGLSMGALFAIEIASRLGI